MDSSLDVPNHITASEDEFWPLSDKPWFNVILKSTHMRPTYTLYVPTEEFGVSPSSSVDVVFTYLGKEWKTVVRREGCSSRTSIKWREFVTDNHLKEGDACVFELTERSDKLIKVRVQILRGDFPYELLNSVDGGTRDQPIIL
ncbi:hypothetical protein DCAR_0934064 [Daucus carota subsp. sativus]|uniref:TF-B3 domain-containing protein n=2 Tax=Daucus carota subsp. sativus TaxID=79200 RepID=A0A175YFB2_DAUCS|nr:PREDICTED: B3 domain-containing protein Os06g0112300-like isoform X2 [Daucus carota subsp. sativus]XP_017225910.1 PREDICTED: B3 domain-containing protein Os06g0112300-like isoform X2 [Daucus carota subsp. sativus]WOH14545.1 hypothetical protein DCAR_0934064 [Daucus carota subsp. sativus]